MRKINITKESVKNTFLVGCKVALYGVAVIKSCSSVMDIVDAVRYSGNLKYSDAINAIMESDMYDSKKNEAMELLKKNEDAEYYKSVVRIVKSDMFDSNKIRAITNLCKDEEEA